MTPIHAKSRLVWKSVNKRYGQTDTADCSTLPAKQRKSVTHSTYSRSERRRCAWSSTNCLRWSATWRSAYNSCSRSTSAVNSSPLTPQASSSSGSSRSGLIFQRLAASCQRDRKVPRRVASTRRADVWCIQPSVTKSCSRSDRRIVRVCDCVCVDCVPFRTQPLICTADDSYPTAGEVRGGGVWYSRPMLLLKTAVRP